MVTGQIINVRLYKDNKDGTPNYKEFVVWNVVNEYYVDICTIEEYEKYITNPSIGTMRNGVQYYEPPWHMSVPIRDVKIN